MFRISLNMLTRQHLMVYGHATVVSFEQQYPPIEKPFITLVNT